MKTGLLFLLCMAASTVASAGSHASFVWTTDDLASAEGVVSTYQRVESMARDYCRQHLAATRDLRLDAACRSRVSEEIVAGIGDARLTAYAETGSIDPQLLARN